MHYHLLALTKFKASSSNTFEIFCPQEFVNISSKGHDSRIGDDTGKKNWGKLFSCKESI